MDTVRRDTRTEPSGNIGGKSHVSNHYLSNAFGQGAKLGVCMNNGNYKENYDQETYRTSKDLRYRVNLRQIKDTL
jgi:hypothetical protein